MTQLRRVLAPVIAIWLFCQIGSVALVPVALWMTGADVHGAECTCGHGAGAICPMHHKPTGGDPAPCAIKAATGSGAAVVTTLAGTAGLIADPIRSIQPAIPSEHPLAADVHAAGERPVPPDPPPPRV
jgi:hypothetical protein